MQAFCNTHSDFHMKKMDQWDILVKTSDPEPCQKLSITVKRQNKTKSLTRNSIRLKFVKKVMSNPIENLGYIKCYS